MQIEILIGALALGVAGWQLYLQKKEQIRNSRINSLIYISNMLESRIKTYSDIIEEMKKDGKNYKGHTKRLHEELKPLLIQTQDELLLIIEKNENIDYMKKIKIALKNKSNK